MPQRQYAPEDDMPRRKYALDMLGDQLPQGHYAPIIVLSPTQSPPPNEKFPDFFDHIFLMWQVYKFWEQLQSATTFV